jgi:hypothetical protein
MVSVLLVALSTGSLTTPGLANPSSASQPRRTICDLARIGAPQPCMVDRIRFLIKAQQHEAVTLRCWIDRPRTFPTASLSCSHAVSSYPSSRCDRFPRRLTTVAATRLLLLLATWGQRRSSRDWAQRLDGHDASEWRVEGRGFLASLDSPPRESHPATTQRLPQAPKPARAPRRTVWR